MRQPSACRARRSRATCGCRRESERKERTRDARAGCDANSGAMIPSSDGVPGGRQGDGRPAIGLQEFVEPRTRTIAVVHAGTVNPSGAFIVGDGRVVGRSGSPRKASRVDESADLGDLQYSGEIACEPLALQIVRVLQHRLALRVDKQQRRLVSRNPVEPRCRHRYQNQLCIR